MPAPGVDRVGRDDILSTFEMYDCKCFAVVQGKDFKFHYIGESVPDALDFFTRNIDGLPPFSTATYTVRFYKSADKNGEITKATPETGSFTFKMHSPSDFNAGYPMMGNVQAIQQPSKEMEDLRKQVQDLKAALELRAAEELEEEEPETLFGQIAGVIGEDNVKILISEGMNIIKNLLGQKTAAAFPQHISGIPDNVPVQDRLTAAIAAMIGEDQAKADALSNAMYIIVKDKDPDFLNTLVQLSQLDQKTYNMAKGLLK